MHSGCRCDLSSFSAGYRKSPDISDAQIPCPYGVTAAISVLMCRPSYVHSCRCLLYHKGAAQLLYICHYSPFLEAHLHISTHGSRREGSDISEKRLFGLARTQSIVQAGYGVVHCTRANVNMIPYQMCNSGYVVIPLQANITRERNCVKWAETTAFSLLKPV